LRKSSNGEKLIDLEDRVRASGMLLPAGCHGGFTYVADFHDPFLIFSLRSSSAKFLNLNDTHGRQVEPIFLFSRDSDPCA